MVTVLYFAWLRDLIGTGEEQVALPPEVATAGALSAVLATRSAGHAEAFADVSKLRVAIDQAMAGFDAPIAGAREIAFFPPVTGG